MTTPEMNTKCGLVSILGLPNAGKSTLTNALVGSKVSIVSDKVQTTRSRVLGILTQDQTQMILMDTPGVFSPKKTLDRAMVKAAWDTMPEADVIVHLVDATDRNVLEKNKMIIQRLPQKGVVFLVLNKTDKVNKPDLLTLAQAFNDVFPYAATFMISSLKKQGLPGLLEAISTHMPEGPWMFEEDDITDMPMRLMAAEITREKIFQQLHYELPYAVLVETEQWEDFEDGSIKISQVIYVQRDSQKAIVVGKGGRQIKHIGEKARLELEELFEARIHLKLFVKVQENWPERAENYRLMGLDF